MKFNTALSLFALAAHGILSSAVEPEDVEYMGCYGPSIEDSTYGDNLGIGYSFEGCYNAMLEKEEELRTENSMKPETPLMFSYLQITGMSMTQCRFVVEKENVPIPNPSPTLQCNPVRGDSRFFAASVSLGGAELNIESVALYKIPTGSEETQQEDPIENEDANLKSKRENGYDGVTNYKYEGCFLPQNLKIEFRVQPDDHLNGTKFDFQDCYEEVMNDLIGASIRSRVNNIALEEHFMAFIRHADSDNTTCAKIYYAEGHSDLDLSQVDQLDPKACPTESVDPRFHAGFGEYTRGDAKSLAVYRLHYDEPQPPANAVPVTESDVDYKGCFFLPDVVGFLLGQPHEMGVNMDFDACYQNILNRKMKHIADGTIGDLVYYMAVLHGVDPDSGKTAEICMLANFQREGLEGAPMNGICGKYPQDERFLWAELPQTGGDEPSMPLGLALYEVVSTGPKKENPTNPTSYGDPHFKTWSGKMYDFHGGCDLVLVKNPQFANGLGMNIHIRTRIHTWWSSIDSAIVQVGDNTLQVTGGTGVYSINGADATELQTANGFLGDFPVLFKRVNDHQTITRIDLGKSDAVGIETFKNFVRVNIRNTSNKSFLGSSGLYGSFPEGVMFARDGVTVMEDPNEFGQEWMVRPSDAILFPDVDATQIPGSCPMPDEMAKKEGRRRLGSASISEEDAALACARVNKLDRDACIFDVMATQDMDMVGSY